MDEREAEKQSLGLSVKHNTVWKEDGRTVGADLIWMDGLEFEEER